MVRLLMLLLVVYATLESPLDQPLECLRPSPDYLLETLPQKNGVTLLEW